MVLTKKWWFRNDRLEIIRLSNKKWFNLQFCSLAAKPVMKLRWTFENDSSLNSLRLTPNPSLHFNHFSELHFCPTGRISATFIIALWKSKSIRSCLRVNLYCNNAQMRFKQLIYWRYDDFWIHFWKQVQRKNSSWRLASSWSAWSFKQLYLIDH